MTHRAPMLGFAIALAAGIVAQSVRARDVAVVALHEPERKEALEQLAAAGWQPGEAPEAEPQAVPPTPSSTGYGWT